MSVYHALYLGCFGDRVEASVEVGHLNYFGDDREARIGGWGVGIVVGLVELFKEVTEAFDTGEA